ncbi:acyl-CoA dehydrogenase [Thermopolyspora sp. NPDC052614]|uniref:acyl-CoA dehydrogenase n=1 Tax=Thermopolyspora sp. NPDC052614 TaxID=3155682 RepID=UPI003436BDD9
MAVAISEEHRELASMTRSFLAAHDARAAARALLEAEEGRLPEFWPEFAGLGLIGLHLPEKYGGGGYGLPELVVVVEELGRAVAPGPFLPTMMASAVIADLGAEHQRAGLLPELASGGTPAALGLSGSLTVNPGTNPGTEPGTGVVTGSAEPVLGAALARLLVLAAGDDLVVLPVDRPGVSVEVPPSLDPARRSARVRLRDVRVTEDDLIRGGRARAEAIARTLVAAEAVGGAAECADMATAHAKARKQFGRAIGTFQAVKHHCADMYVAAEIGTAAVWDAARAAAGPQDEFELAAAVALGLAVPAFVRNAQLGIQVHGAIGLTWEHDAQLLLRRAATLAAVFPASAADEDVIKLSAKGVRREVLPDITPDEEAVRTEIRTIAREIAALPAAEQRRALIDSGCLQPHWPRPWGRAASAGVQRVIDEEFAAAGVTRPRLGITGWLMLALIQHGTQDQLDRYLGPALAGDETWCQMFSEPEAGSDAAGVKTRAVRAEGGWLVNGQKAWTSGAHRSRRALATVRTGSGVPKHAGITTMIIDLRAPGVEIRPIRQITGDADFNEVFLTDVFVPDGDVVGEPGKGWPVARALLADERIAIGDGDPFEVTDVYGHDDLLRYGDRVPGGVARIGHHLAERQAMRLLNLRRALTGAEPGAQGSVTKLVLSEHGHETATLLAALTGPDLAFTDGPGATAALLTLRSRIMSVAWGTSEINRNLIAERLLGLPRDPLVS